jgi:hypothetical protein
MRPERRYSYIWSTSRRPPLRAMRWAVLIGGAAILLFLFIEGATVELDDTLRQAWSLVDQFIR